MLRSRREHSEGKEKTLELARTPWKSPTDLYEPTIPHPTTHATVTTLPRQAMPWSDTDLPFERRRACREAAQRQSELASGQAAVATRPHEPPFEEERILMMHYITT
jgi:hypothetical protein